MPLLSEFAARSLDLFRGLDPDERIRARRIRAIDRTIAYMRDNAHEFRMTVWGRCTAAMILRAHGRSPLDGFVLARAAQILHIEHPVAVALFAPSQMHLRPIPIEEAIDVLLQLRNTGTFAYRTIPLRAAA